MVPHDIELGELPREVRSELQRVTGAAGDFVARHLVMAGRLIDEDPELAYRHAAAARDRLPRLASVREAAGLCAYATGRWAEALAELRAHRRIAGGGEHLPVMADCERGLGRPERALELAASDDARRLRGAAAAELRIVVSGARRDLGQPQAAVVALQGPDLDPARRDPWSVRLFYAYAEALLAAARPKDAYVWFRSAAGADTEAATDAQERLAALEAEGVGSADAGTALGRAATAPAAAPLVVVLEEPEGSAEPPGR